MKRLAFLAAAALLGSGCIVHNDNPGGGCYAPTITVQWNTANGFTLGDGSAMGCAGLPGSVLPVAFVDIFMNDVLVDRWSCSDGGAVITNVAPGTYRLTVEGVEATTGRIAYRDEFNATASSCGDQAYEAQPAEGYVSVSYGFAGGGTCIGSLPNDPSFLWFSVFDDISNSVAAEVSEKTPASEQQYWCGANLTDGPTIAPHSLDFPLAAGTYTMRWIEERYPVATVRGASCTPFDFTVHGGTTNVIPASPVVLANTSTACVHP